MIGHEHVGVQVPPESPDDGTEKIEESEVVLVVAEDGLSLVPPRCHVPGRIGMVEPKGTSHSRILPRKTELTPILMAGRIRG